MRKNVLFSVLIASAFTAWNSSAAVYKETGGVAVINAIHFDARTGATDDDHRYAIAPDELSADEAGAQVGSYLNARGGKYMVNLPESGQNRNNDDLANAGPTIQWKVQIATTGEYTLYVRNTGFDGGSDSAYFSILELQTASGGAGPDWYRYNPVPADSDFNSDRHSVGAGGWDNQMTPEIRDAGGGEVAAVWNITKAGTYTIRMQQREDGNAMDAICLQRSNLPAPAPDIPESQIVGATPQPLFVVSQTPAAGAKSAAFNTPISFTLQEGSTTLDKSSVVLKLDNSPVTPTITAGAGGAVTVMFQPPSFLAANSTHTVTLDFKDSAGKASNVAFSFTVQNYITLPASSAVTADTTKKGFLVRTYQTTDRQATTLARGEAVLAGQLGDNVAANTAIFTDQQFDHKYFDEPGTINYWNTGGEGNFSNNGTQNTPGLANDSTDDDNYVMEFIAFLDLPAGVIKMGVNSDDDFRTTFSPSGDPRDKLPVVLGQFEGGRGAADSLFTFVVEKAGVYAFRTIFYEMGGGSEVEWFTVSSDNKKHLINDGSDAASIKAYRAAQGGPFVKTFTPDFFGFTLALADSGAALLDEKTVAITLDGNAAQTTATKSGDTTTVVYQPSAAWVGGSVHTLLLSFKDKAGKSYSRTSTFTAPTGFIPASYAVGPADTSKKGFLVRTWQSPGQPNTLAWTEDQLDGKHGTNRIAHPEIFTDSQYGNKYLDESGVIDYWNSGGEGNFPNNATQNVPGLANDGANDDNYSIEAFTFLDLPAGKVTMGVNSDDGFRVYVVPTGDPRDKGIPLGQFDAGRGVADTIFDLSVEKAGVYPFRMIYEEGGGDSAVEWFSVTPDGNKHLINDAADSASIKAFRAATVVAPPPASKFTGITRSAGSITISWTGTGILQSADEITGPWQDVPGATSPRTITPTGSRKFYRFKP